MSSAQTWDGASFSSVGGLDQHLDRLHQMVMLPSLCRDVYDLFHMKPPRGILFYGPPGTGKTLVAGALARECSRAMSRVQFFYRKSADILNMWLGESEKTLTHLFEEARRRRPAIIFFDEIDGLAPARCARSDHVHTSIVSTLLALMDGLDDASDVIVIGATNRIDAVDPALRRPGRFDVELFFPLPGMQARLEIMRLLTRPWRESDRPAEAFLRQLARSTSGYCGADLQALCRGAVTCALCRQFPELASHRREARPSAASLRHIQVTSSDFLEAKSLIVPANRRAGSCMAKRLSPEVQPLFRGTLDHTITMLEQYCPFEFLHPDDRSPAMPETSTLLCRMLVAGTPQQGHTRHLAPALLEHLQHLPVYPLDVVALFDGCKPHPEAACIQVVKEARRNAPSILYLPDVSSWWGQVSEQTRVVLLAMVRDMDPREPLLLLATSDCPHCDMPIYLRELFREELGQVVSMKDPSSEEREAYYEPLRSRALRPPQHPDCADKLLDPSSRPDQNDQPIYDPDLQEPELTTCYLRRSKRKRKETGNPSKIITRKRRGTRPELKTKMTRLVPNNPTSSSEVIREKWDTIGSPRHDINEVDENVQESEITGRVEIDIDALYAFFEHVVTTTDGCQFQTLEAIYNGLNIAVTKYSSHFQRQQLLVDMQIFMKNFEEVLKRENHTPPPPQNNKTYLKQN